MRHAIVWSLGLLFAAGLVRADEPRARTVEDVWNVALLDGHPAGYVHTTVAELPQEGKKLLRTTTDLNLTVRRFNDTAQLRMESGTDETPQGRVTGVFMRQYIAKQQQLAMTGTVEGNQLHYKVEGGFQLDKRIPWNPEVVGLYRQDRLFAEQKVRPGDRFTYLSFEPTVMAVVRTHVAVGDYEDVDVLGQRRKLLRADAVMDKIQNVQLPTVTSWLDEEFRTVRSEFDLQGFGKLAVVRSTKERATRPGAVARASDIGIKQLVRLDRPIPQPHETTEVVYRITLKGDDDPGSAFARDGRQEVRSVKGNTVELVVRAGREPQAREGAEPPGDEFLKSNYFINSSDARVQQLARKAVGGERDPWRKALRIEKWVHDNMQVQNFTEALATADEVARTLEGDCTEFAMLTAAMCRAAGLPSRTAIGLVYVDMARGPVFGFHMWTEVWVRGQWVPLDATLGRGHVGAAHIKITDHSWHETQSLTPLLPVLRVLGKLSIEVVRVNGAE